MIQAGGWVSAHGLYGWRRRRRVRVAGGDLHREVTEVVAAMVGVGGIG